MRFLLVFLILIPVLRGQPCGPAARLQPLDIVAGALGETDCRLTNGAAYVEYSLTLPVRGQIEIQAAPFAAVLRDSRGRRIGSGGSVRAAAEAGAYTVVIHGANGADTGPFTLRSSFAPEPGLLCRAFPFIGLNDSAAAWLSAASCRLPDGAAYDAYQVRTLGTGTLSVTLESEEIGPRLILRDADGRALTASDEGALEYLVRGDSLYTIVATGSSPGRYRLATSFKPAEGEECRPLATLQPPAGDERRINRTGCAVEDPETGERMYFNWYELKAPEAGTVDVRLYSAVEPMLHLLDPSGNLVAADSLTSERGIAIIRAQVRPGNYTLLAWTQLPFGGDYTLSYEFSPGAPPTPPALALAPGAALVGNLTTTSSGRTAEGVSDVYQIVTQGPGTLEIEMASGDFDAFLALRDALDNRLAANDNSGGTTNSRIAADLPAGSYSVVAASRDRAGGYNISYKFTPHELAPCPAATRLDFGYIGKLDTTSCHGADGQPVDYYEMTTPGDGTSAVTLTSFYLDSYLTLEDTEGNVLRRDDNSYGDNDAIVVQFLPGRTYRVGVRSAAGETTGFYELRRYFSGGGPGNACTEPRPLALGDALDGRLNFTSCEYPNNTFADIYRFELAETTSVELALDSREVDAFLALYDARGNLIDEDDDGGGDTNSLIAASLDPGIYYLVARSAYGYSGGSYRLSTTKKE